MVWRSELALNIVLVLTEPIRLYMSQYGSLKRKTHDTSMSQGNGAPYEIPVSFFLVAPPEGHVLIEGGKNRNDCTVLMQPTEAGRHNSRTSSETVAAVNTK